MIPFRVRMICCLLAFIAGSAEYASAGWNNVFQVTCFGRFRQSTSAFFQAPSVAFSSPVVAFSSPAVAFSSPVVALSSPACCTPCPQTTCTTNFVQRCYYQPVTTYQTQTYYEPVTTYRTSYYYEPVVSYSYSCFFDPCTCSFKQVAVPTTSYQLRAQSCPVQSWVQRCMSVPVVSYQKCCFWEPQTTCCTTGGAVASPTAPAAVPQAPTQQPPGVTEQRYSSPPIVTEQQQQQGNGSRQYDSYYNQQPNSGGQSRQPGLGDPEPPMNRPSSLSVPPVRLDRIVSAPNTPLEGQIVGGDQTPQRNARLLFVNADQFSSQQMATTNGEGRFNVSLASGRWHVYIERPNGQREYHSRINVSDGRNPFITLVSR